jgi:hypothetical protein
MFSPYDFRQWFIFVSFHFAEDTSIVANGKGVFVSVTLESKNIEEGSSNLEEIPSQSSQVELGLGSDTTTFAEYTDTVQPEPIMAAPQVKIQKPAPFFKGKPKAL